MSFRLGDLVPAGLFPKATRAQRGCYDKRKFGSPGAARAALRALLRADYCRDGDQLTVYPCPRCLGWHVGHLRRTNGSGNRDRDR